jgi:hypothetical protein
MVDWMAVGHHRPGGLPTAEEMAVDGHHHLTADSWDEIADGRLHTGLLGSRLSPCETVVLLTTNESCLVGSSSKGIRHALLRFAECGHKIRGGHLAGPGATGARRSQLRRVTRTRRTMNAGLVSPMGRVSQLARTRHPVLAGSQLTTPADRSSTAISRGHATGTAAAPWSTGSGVCFAAEAAMAARLGVS